MNVALIPELDIPFTFHRRPAAVPPDLRPEWRIGLVLLILRRCCRQERSSFSRLHVLGWASQTPSTRASLLQVLAGVNNPDSLLVRIDPALNRAVDLAHGANLVTKVKGDKVQLTSLGKSAADVILANSNLLSDEQAFAHSLGLRVTEQLVKSIFSYVKG